MHRGDRGLGLGVELCGEVGRGRSLQHFCMQ